MIQQKIQSRLKIKKKRKETYNHGSSHFARLFPWL